jgi:pyruvate/2-oxoglutarate dehydrogenase complex dihydrolipoamide dehydrogenase (E3) component
MARYDYDLIVIGGGAAGLTSAGVGASLGARTLLIERHRLGGDCTWTGCVPSKTLLKAADVVHRARHADRYGLEAAEPAVPFGRLMEHVRSLRQHVYEGADSPEVLAEFGVEVALGAATFEDPHTIGLATEDGGRRITARRFVIATGARPSIPPIQGFAEGQVLTSDSLFELQEQPRRLAIIGAGPIGMEMSQAFTRLGTEVTVIDRASRALGREDPDHAGRLTDVLRRDGVRFLFDTGIDRLARDGRDYVVHLNSPGREDSLRFDAVLAATGRTPNIEDLGLAEARVPFTGRGVIVDERCRTAQKHIFAAGDVTGEYQLTHMSEHMAKVAVTNAILRVPAKLDRANVSWATFTDPELARLGASEEELRQRGEAYETFHFPYDRVDRAVTDGETDGEIKILATRWRGRILGASVLGERGGELISLLAVAMKNGVTLRQLSDTIIPYPTYGLGARRAADQWYARKQHPLLVRSIQKVFGYRGAEPKPIDPARVV